MSRKHLGAAGHSYDEEPCGAMQGGLAEAEFLHVEKKIIVDVNRQETRVALLEQDSLAELYIERKGRRRIVGNIYIGKVQNVLPGMQAAFVDIGQERNAFLYAGDILSDKGDLEFPDQQTQPEIPASIQDAVKPGQQLLLQVLKEPVGSKGARVTTNITLPGRNLVLMPTVNYIGVSRRIEDEEERSRLRDIIERCRPEGMGVIVRTVGEGKEEGEFTSEMAFLEQLWGQVNGMAAHVQAPALVHSEEALLFRTVRDLLSDEVSALVVNEQASWQEVKKFADVLSPEYLNRIQFYQGEEDLFERYQLDGQIDKLLQRRVWLRSGGYLIIDQTEALTVVDVNTGKYVGTGTDVQKTLSATNMEAAAEIARQLRLRDIGGIIIIDFIDMESQENRDQLIDTLQMHLKKDRTKSNIVGMTGLGLVEMTRKKVRASLRSTMLSDCPHCRGEGRVLSEESVALRIRRNLLRNLRASSCEDWLVEASPSIARMILERAAEGQPVLDGVQGRNIYIKKRAGWDSVRFEIVPLADPEERDAAVRHAERLGDRA